MQADGRREIRERRIATNRSLPARSGCARERIETKKLQWIRPTKRGPDGTSKQTASGLTAGRKGVRCSCVAYADVVARQLHTRQITLRTTKPIAFCKVVVV